MCLKNRIAQQSCSSALSSLYLELPIPNVVESLPIKHRIIDIFQFLEQSQYSLTYLDHDSMGLRQDHDSMGLRQVILT